MVVIYDEVALGNIFHKPPKEILVGDLHARQTRVNIYQTDFVAGGAAIPALHCVVKESYQILYSLVLRHSNICIQQTQATLPSSRSMGCSCR